MSEDFIAKLDEWVKKNKEAAETPTINITTGKEFTIKGLLEKMKRETEEKVSILDPLELKIKNDIQEWLEDQEDG